MILPIYKRALSIAQANYQQALKEAERAEDEDKVIVEDIPEECPSCSVQAEIREWISKQVITRIPEFIVVHCTGTVITATVSAIIKYWREKLKWNNPGYDIIIKYDGSVTFLTDLDTITNGVAGYNSRSWNICTIGGVDTNGKLTDTRSPEQKETLRFIVKELKQKAMRANVKGHRDFPNVKKACPCYDAIEEFQNI